MRILILADRIPPQYPGGAEKIAWNLARGLHALGHEVHVITTTEGRAYETLQEGIPTYYLHSAYPQRLWHWFSLLNPGILRQLRPLYQRIQPELVNAHNVHGGLSFASLWLAARMGLPVVFNAHDMMTVAYTKLDHFVDPTRCGVKAAADYRLPPFFNLRQNRLRYNPFRNAGIRHILRHAVRARIAISQAQQQALEANHLPPFQVIPNGLDPAPFARPAEAVLAALRERFGLAGRKVVLFGGRLSAAKGSLQLLKAFEQLVQQMPNACLLILSASPLEPALLQAFPGLEEGHLRQVGWLEGETLAAAYHLADVVVYPSVYLDAFGMMNLEAMAAGKPVIATCYGGAAEIVLDGETGYIVNPFDTLAFSQHMITLLEDAQRCHQMGAAGFARLQQHFTLNHQVARQAAVYQTVIDAPPP